MRSSLLSTLRVIVPAALLFLILLGLFLPIYTDEVGWRLQERAAFDGVDKMYSEQCGPGSLARPPFFMMPVRYYSAFFNSHFADPFYVRLAGIAYALLWLWMVWGVIRALTDKADERAILSLIGASLLTLGIVPLLLVWSRPEQPVLLAITASILSALRHEQKSSASAVPLAPMGIGLLAIIAFSYHVKGVVLAPAFLLCLAFSASGRRTLPVRIGVGLMIGAATLVAAHYWTERMACRGDPVLAAMYARYNIGLVVSSGAPVTQILAHVLNNANLTAYYGQVAPAIEPMSNWIAPYRISPGGEALLRIAATGVWIEMSVIGLAMLLGRIIEAVAGRIAPFRTLLPLFLAGYVLVWSTTQSIKNVYDLSLIIPLLVLTLIFLFAGVRPKGRMEGIARGALILLAGASLISASAVATLYTPSLLATRDVQGYIEDQPFSVPVFGYDKMEPRIRKAAAVCGLSPDKRHNSLLVDDLTYFTFMRSRLPQHRLGVIGPWNGSAKDPIAYLHGRKSDGAILACRYLPPEMRAKARETDGLCCLGGAGW